MNFEEFERRMSLLNTIGRCANILFLAALIATLCATFLLDIPALLKTVNVVLYVLTALAMLTSVIMLGYVFINAGKDTDEDTDNVPFWHNLMSYYPKLMEAMLLILANALLLIALKRHIFMPLSAMLILYCVFTLPQLSDSIHALHRGGYRRKATEVNNREEVTMKDILVWLDSYHFARIAIARNILELLVSAALSTALIIAAASTFIL